MPEDMQAPTAPDTSSNMFGGSMAPAAGTEAPQGDAPGGEQRHDLMNAFPDTATTEAPTAASESVSTDGTTPGPETNDSMDVDQPAAGSDAPQGDAPGGEQRHDLMNAFPDTATAEAPTAASESVSTDATMPGSETNESMGVDQPAAGTEAPQGDMPAAADAAMPGAENGVSDTQETAMSGEAGMGVEGAQESDDEPDAEKWTGGADDSASSAEVKANSEQEVTADALIESMKKANLSSEDRIKVAKALFE